MERPWRWKWAKNQIANNQIPSDGEPTPQTERGANLKCVIARPGPEGLLRGESLDLSVDDEPFRSIPAPGDMRGDPGLLAMGTGDFEFDNFVIADVE